MFGILLLGILMGVCGTLIGERIYCRWYYKDFNPEITELSEEEWEEIVALFEEEEDKYGIRNE